MITCSALRGYQPTALEGKAQEVARAADRLHEVAERYRRLARTVAEAWPDPTGQEAATSLLQLAEGVDREADRVAKIAPILDTAAAEITVAQQKLAAADQTDAADPFLAADDTGTVTLSAPAMLLPPLVQLSKFHRATQLTHSYRNALLRATKADQSATNALYELAGRTPPYEDDTGPVDLSDAAIRDQAMNSVQGGYGDCYFLSSLAAIGNADPQFIRDHMRWNPDTGRYEVTIYENTPMGVIGRTVEVDPDTLPDATRGPDGEVTFLSVYEEAYRQTVHGAIFTRTGGLPSDAMLAITGHEADATLVRPASFDEIRETVEAQPPGAVAVATNPGGPWPDPEDVPYEQRLCPRHAYWVRGFDDQGRIILVNTWGTDGGTSGGVDYPGEVHLTEEQFREQTMQTARTVP